jgi:NAD(P)-dependent dehydrogenase (short-subunit alcohol dehydrogenase family)
VSKSQSTAWTQTDLVNSTQQLRLGYTIYYWNTAAKHMAPQFDVQGKVVAITGGARGINQYERPWPADRLLSLAPFYRIGIGFATAELLLSQGCKVSIADVLAETLKEAEDRLKAGQHPGEFITTVVDVRRAKEVDDWIQKTVERFGKLDGGINLAGVIPKSINIDGVEDMKDEDWHFVLDVNLTGGLLQIFIVMVRMDWQLPVMHCMRAQLRQMNDKGSIINAASVAGIAGFAKNAAYTATKHAVIGLSRSAAKEVGNRGIRVNCIAPWVAKSFSPILQH